MRYLDIPDLPIRAFLHNGIKGKICLYKGGGDVVDWAKDQLDETPVVSNPSDTFSQIDKEVIQPVTFQVNDVAQKIGDVGNQIDQAVNDNVPGGWVLPAVITAAVVAPELLPEIAPEVVGEGAVGAESAGIGDIGLSGTEAGDLTYFDTPTDTSYLNDFAPTDTGTAQLGSGTSLSADASTNPLNPFYNVANPEVQANLGTVSNLVGGGAESNLATLGSNPLIPTTGAGIGGSELGAIGSIIGSGEGLGVQTLPETLAPTGLNGLTPNDLLSQPTDIPNPSVTVSDVADAAKTAKNIANLLKATNTSQQQISNTQQNLAKSQALSNMLRNQVQGTEAPTPYKAPNFFTFTPDQPVQNNLASLLRNNYGNS